jgi:hypothetical protein
MTVRINYDESGNGDNHEMPQVHSKANKKRDEKIHRAF